MDPYQYQQQAQLHLQQQYAQQAQYMQYAYVQPGQYGGAYTTAVQPQAGIANYPGAIHQTYVDPSQAYSQALGVQQTAFAVQGYGQSPFLAASDQTQQPKPALSLTPLTEGQSHQAVSQPPLPPESNTSGAPPLPSEPVPVTSTVTTPATPQFLDEAKKKYQEQYQQWQQQYAEWQAQHASHPDQKQFQEYQQQMERWQQQQQQLLQPQQEATGKGEKLGLPPESGAAAPDSSGTEHPTQGTAQGIQQDQQHQASDNLSNAGCKQHGMDGVQQFDYMHGLYPNKLPPQEQGIQLQQQGMPSQHQGVTSQQQGMSSHQQGMPSQQKGMQSQQQSMSSQQGIQAQQQGMPPQQHGNFQHNRPLEHGNWNQGRQGGFESQQQSYNTGNQQSFSNKPSWLQNKDKSRDEIMRSQQVSGTDPQDFDGNWGRQGFQLHSQQQTPYQSHNEDNLNQQKLNTKPSWLQGKDQPHNWMQSHQDSRSKGNEGFQAQHQQQTQMPYNVHDQQHLGNKPSWLQSKDSPNKQMPYQQGLQAKSQGFHSQQHTANQEQSDLKPSWLQSKDTPNKQMQFQQGSQTKSQEQWSDLKPSWLQNKYPTNKPVPYQQGSQANSQGFHLQQQQHTSNQEQSDFKSSWFQGKDFPNKQMPYQQDSQAKSPGFHLQQQQHTANQQRSDLKPSWPQNKEPTNKQVPYQQVTQAKSPGFHSQQQHTANQQRPDLKPSWLQNKDPTNKQMPYQQGSQAKSQEFHSQQHTANQQRPDLKPSWLQNKDPTNKQMPYQQGSQAKSQEFHSQQHTANQQRPDLKPSWLQNKDPTNKQMPYQQGSQAKSLEFHSQQQHTANQQQSNLKPSWLQSKDSPNKQMQFQQGSQAKSLGFHSQQQHAVTANQQQSNLKPSWLQSKDTPNKQMQLQQGSQAQGEGFHSQQHTANQQQSDLKPSWLQDREQSSKWMQGQQGFSKNQQGLEEKPKEIPKEIPKWLQVQKQEPQPAEGKTEIPKWLEAQKVSSNQDVQGKEEPPKQLPKWLQGHSQEDPPQEQKLQVQQQQQTQEQKTLPKWMQVTKSDATTAASTETSHVGSKAEGLQTGVQKDESQIQHQKHLEHLPTSTVSQTRISTAVSSSTSSTDESQRYPTTTSTSSLQATAPTPLSSITGLTPKQLHVDPKKEIEMLQKQSLQLMQLAELERKKKLLESSTGKLPGRSITSSQPSQSTEEPRTAIFQPPFESKLKSSSEPQHGSGWPPGRPLAVTQPSAEATSEECRGPPDRPPEPARPPTPPLKKVPCRFFPTCRYGDGCRFKHPPCESGNKCTKRDCIYDHSKPPLKPVTEVGEQPDNAGGVETGFKKFPSPKGDIPGIGDSLADAHKPTEKPVEGDGSHPVPVPEHEAPPRDYPGNRPYSSDEWDRQRLEGESWRSGREEWEQYPGDRGQSPPYRDDRDRPPYPRGHDWERDHPPRDDRMPPPDEWDRPPVLRDERERLPPPRENEFGRCEWEDRERQAYDRERWPPRDEWDRPGYRDDRGSPPYSPRDERARYPRPPYDRERSPERNRRERSPFGRDYRDRLSPRSCPPEELDRYGRPLPPHPDDYERRRDWEDRERDYRRSPPREWDRQEWRDHPESDKRGERYVEDYDHGRGRLPPPHWKRDPEGRWPDDYPPDRDRRGASPDRAYDRRPDDRYPPLDRHPTSHDPHIELDDHGYPVVHVPEERLPPEIPRVERKAQVVQIETILDSPGRDIRPDRIVIILRGPPGSGKTHVARLIKDKEVSKGAHAPRILGLDDYFLAEVEKTEKDPDTGKRIKKKVTEYVYEAEMEETYQASLFKSFTKTLDNGFFPVVILDAINNKIEHFEKYWSHAKQKGFEVYIAELSADAHVCAKRNSHHRTFEEINKMVTEWEESPVYMLRLDVRSLLQDSVITEVEMETADEPSTSQLKQEGEDKETNGEEEEKSEIQIPKRSKWDDVDLTAEEQLNKLDGIRPLKRRRPESPPMALGDDDDPYDEKEEDMRIGKKRVRWADIEESKHMEHRRRIGFCIGTDWSLLTDPNARIPEH